MQIQFICYKPKFMNLELRYKLTRVLIRLLIKIRNKKYKNRMSINPSVNTVHYVYIFKNCMHCNQSVIIVYAFGDANAIIVMFD